jgi:hypothetical protein
MGSAAPSQPRYLSAWTMALVSGPIRKAERMARTAWGQSPQVRHLGRGSSLGGTGAQQRSQRGCGSVRHFTQHRRQTSRSFSVVGMGRSHDTHTGANTRSMAPSARSPNTSLR